MNNRNLGILIAIIVLETAAICFTLYKSKTDAASETAFADQSATMEPAADKAATAPAPEGMPTVDNPVVATVDGKNILRAEVIAFMRNFPPQLQQMPVESLFPMAQEQVVTAKIVDEKASKVSGLADDAEVQKRLADAKIQIMRAVYLEKEIEKQVSDERLNKAYDKFKTTQSNIEEVHARHILVEKEETAREIIQKLADGGKFEDLAKEYSKDPSNKDTGGDLGYFTKEAMVKEFADAAFAAGKGEVLADPIKTQFGYHVVEILDKRTKPVPAFEEVKQGLAVEERRQILNEIVADWRKGADVKLLDINGKPVEKKPAETPKEETKSQ